MQEKVYEREFTGLLQAGGAQTFMLSAIPGANQATFHQITMHKETSTTGTLAPAVFHLNEATAVSLKDAYGAAISHALTGSAETYGIENKRIDGWQVTPTSVDAAYGFTVTGWR